MRFQKSKNSDLSSDLGLILDELRALLSTKEKEEEPAFTQIRQKLEATVEKVRTTSSNAIEQSKELAQNTDEYVHDSPWSSIGGALAVGALIGFMLGKR